ncbi:hypothetical protein BW247_05315 [Acidihalobacter ferrooxydans]|uniref:Alkylmercury lyase n=1 Tax=Acidihalobacter ferrooxydans TaxID=1765967 RepID=A0A1P8UFG7_9GAMM|nr:hypothetical protein BW247_05315 [Acidihalobacter ferrooxydans]
MLALSSHALQDYRRLIEHWCDSASPLATDALSSESLHTLLAIDAVVDQSGQLGCYPFSVLPTGIQVQLGDRSVHAMCAIDALAVSRVSGQASRIVAPCALCETQLALGMHANGSLHEVMMPEAAVLWTDETQGSCGTNACCNTLCPSIRFVCRSCAEIESKDQEGDIFTVPQAAVIANAFFGFQARLCGLEIG